MGDYPEHDKLRAHKDEAETISELWDWMQEQGIVLAKWGQVREREIPCSACTGRKKKPGQFAGLDYEKLTTRQRQMLNSRLLPAEISAYRKTLPPCPACDGSGKVWETYEVEGALDPLHITAEAFIGRFLEIDPKKLSDEKDQMLADIREANARSAA